MMYINRYIGAVCFVALLGISPVALAEDSSDTDNSDKHSSQGIENQEQPTPEISQAEKGEAQKPQQVTATLNDLKVYPLF